MPLITPDFSESPESTGIPAGAYCARITGGELTKSKKTDAPMVKWDLEVFNAEAELSRFNGWRLNTWTMLSGKAAGRLRDLYQAATNTNMPDAGFDTDELLGKEVKVIVAYEPDKDGNTSKYPSVKAIKKI